MSQQVNLQNYAVDENRIRKPLLFSAKKEKRFYAGLLDLLFSLILAFILYYSVSLPVSKNLTHYDNNVSSAIQYRNEMTKYQVNAHLIELDSEGKEVNVKTTFLNYLDRKLENKNYDNENNLLDNFAYYYTVHHIVLFPNDATTYDIAWYNINILGLPKNINDKNYSTCWQYAKDSSGNLDSSQLGVFREDTNFKADLMAYLDNKIYDATQTAYNDLQTWFTNTLSDAELSVSTAENYKAIYKEYVNTQVNISWMYTEASIPVFAFSLLVFFAIIPLFFRKGCSLGKLICKIGVTTSEAVEANKFQILIRGLVQSLELLGFFVVITFFDLGVLFSFTLPVISFNGNYVINSLTVVLVSGVLLLVSFLFMIFSNNSNSLHDLISQTKAIDLKRTKVFKSSEEREQEIERLNREEKY